MKDKNKTPKISPHNICQYYDLIDEFVAHVSQTGISLNSTIKPSIYETNNFLLQKEKKVTLIEYSFFYGSIQIVNFLKLNEIKLEQSMLPYAIHGHNLDLIHFFDAKNEEEFNVNFFYEAIKCHHNDIAGYFKNNFMMFKYIILLNNIILVFILTIN